MKLRLSSLHFTCLVALSLSEKVHCHMGREDVVDEGLIFTSNVAHFLALLDHFPLPEKQSTRHQFKLWG